jgi:hypothetical protein
MINDARCTREIKARFTMEKAAFNEKKTSFTSILDLSLTKKLVKCYIWSIALYGAENGRFENRSDITGKFRWCSRRKERFSPSFSCTTETWTDRVRNEEVLHIESGGEGRDILQTIKKERPTGLVTSCLGTAF